MPRNPNLRPNVAYDCGICGRHVERYMTPSDQAKYPPKYCSRRCAGIAHRGPAHPMWAGGRRTNDQGYVLVYRPDHPQADAKGLVREHRLVVEQALGRFLRPEEVVHHKDGKEGHNDLANLRLFANNAEHKAYEDRQRERDRLGRLLPIGGAV